MKKLIIVNGTMGVGKTTTCLELQKLLPQNVFLDGDWCWKMEPFVVNDETKAMVMDNIAHLLNNFIQCSEYENIIFCWVMHEQSIIDELLERLGLQNCREYVFSLICSEEALTRRIQKDIMDSKRTEDVLVRSVPRLSNYAKINSIKIDVSKLTPIEAVNEIRNRILEA